jgi:DNA-binding transcriptional ArsR family regulator
MYHIIAAREPISFGDLCSLLDAPVQAVEASLKRLRDKLLIDTSGELIRLLSVQEMLIRCRLKYSRDCRFSFEDGVIRARPEGKDGE